MLICLICVACLLVSGNTSHVRIPASLCGIIGLKTTYGRTDMTTCDRISLVFF